MPFRSLAPSGHSMVDKRQPELAKMQRSTLPVPTVTFLRCSVLSLSPFSRSRALVLMIFSPLVTPSLQPCISTLAI